MLRSAGCRLWDANGREFVDCLMALGAVALGYAHPTVNRAAVEALDSGVVGSLAPVLEAELAGELRRLMPHLEQLRFLKTGAEACAAAVTSRSRLHRQGDGARLRIPRLARLDLLRARGSRRRHPSL
jgi:glutamate-1-semialdehyde aminotransferase